MECHLCDTPVPEDATSCHVCGAVTHPVASTPLSPPSVAPPDPPAWFPGPPSSVPVASASHPVGLPPVIARERAPGQSGPRPRIGLRGSVGVALVFVVGGTVALQVLRPGATPSSAMPVVTRTAVATASTHPDTPAPLPTPTPRHTAAPPLEAPQVEVPATPLPASYPTVLVIEGRECGRFGTGPWSRVGTYNATTSCRFALKVREAYLERGLGGATGEVYAWSPTTKKGYVMSCSGSQPVRCVGGVAARVIIYGGDLALEG